MRRWGRGRGPWWLQADIFELFRIFTAGPRMAIIKILRNESKSSGEIYEELLTKYQFDIPRSLLYYHLDALEKMGIIEMVQYRETGKGGAPEKVWKLKVKRIIFDIIEGKIILEYDDGEKVLDMYVL